MDVDVARARGQLTVVDADEFLPSFMQVLPAVARKRTIETADELVENRT